MTRISRLTVLFFLCGLLPFSVAFGQLKLPALVGDSMVIQRDTNLKVWGWAKPGEQVRVKFKGKSYKAKTAADGTWHVSISPVKAGGPYTMEIAGESEAITLQNVLVGDVWLCSGQSNMVHYLGRHQERYAEEIANAHYPEIRQFLIPTATDLQGPKDQLPEISWKAANPHNVLQFSVVGYFFAKNLYDKYKIPIGLINASVGGTPIEAWTSEEGLKEFPEMQATIEKNKDTAYVNSTNRAAQEDMRALNQKRGKDEGLLGEVKWYEAAYEPMNWKRINIPGYWEDQGIRDLDGVVWYRREIDIPAKMVGVPAKIALGRIVDADEVYVNGHKVGNTTYQYPQREYEFPAEVLKPGKNLFVVKVTNYNGKGGFVPDKPYYLAAGGDTLDLKGYWQYKVGEVFVNEGSMRRGISAQNQPTALFNAMIAPYTDYAIKGVLWYQGESNSGRPEEYKKLLPALIMDWRHQWDKEDLPFLYVQLPNFMEVNYSPEESNWAEMREAQREALSIPNTAMAVAIDLGEWNDIHPGKKKPIGDRLALAARKMVYGEENIVYSGPTVKSSRVEGNKVILTFDHVGGGLVSGNGEELAHFAVAGADKKFKWASAEIKGNTIVLWNEDIPDPQFVRYAWADNPDFANLYNKEGLPASPFQVKVGKGD